MEPACPSSGQVRWQQYPTVSRLLVPAPRRARATQPGVRRQLQLSPLETEQPGAQHNQEPDRDPHEVAHNGGACARYRTTPATRSEERAVTAFVGQRDHDARPVDRTSLNRQPDHEVRAVKQAKAIARSRRRCRPQDRVGAFAGSVPNRRRRAKPPLGMSPALIASAALPRSRCGRRLGLT